jgi:hypothetical protein
VCARARVCVRRGASARFRVCRGGDTCTTYDLKVVPTLASITVQPSVPSACAVATACMVMLELAAPTRAGPLCCCGTGEMV